jgi:hypothetical protein
VVPRYFFHVYDGNAIIARDTQGIDLPEKSAALQKCAAIVRSVLDEEGLSGSFTEEKVLRVVDESDRIIATVPLHLMASLKF